MSEEVRSEAERRRRRIIVTACVCTAFLWLFCLLQSTMPIGLTFLALLIVTVPIAYTTVTLARKADASPEWTPDGAKKAKGKKKPK